ncbi:MAG: hypothetical protein HY812_06070 [Planctomycetes bacterium]|nr:hypothetical protein [Planctomycetota bacterium]
MATKRATIQRLWMGGVLLVLAGGARGQVQIQPRMGEPLPGLTPSERARFFAGQAMFNTPLSTADGLGPIFNDKSCAACHGSPTIGGASTRTVTMFARTTPVFDDLAALGGPLLQSQALSEPCREFVPPEADLVFLRTTPICFGVGLVEAIDEQDLFYLEQFPPPGVSGIARLVQAIENPSGPPMVGKYGWKADLPTVMSWSAGPSRNEVGLTNRFLTQDSAPNGNTSLLSLCDTVADPEDGPDAFGFDRIDRFADFMSFLAPPPQTPRSGMTGEALFNAVGCASCHVPSFTTGAAASAALANQAIKPYGDYLLHDMGTLGDQFGNASLAPEMMTRALWGMSQREAFLHDGRATGGTFAQDVDSAIQHHDGEAALARAGYNAFSATDKGLLVGFLASLGRAEFDFENDNDVDEFDWFFLNYYGWFNGPAEAPGAPALTPDQDGAVADIDQDGDFDLRDWGYYQRAFTGQ